MRKKKMNVYLNVKTMFYGTNIGYIFRLYKYILQFFLIFCSSFLDSQTQKRPIFD